MEPYKTFLVPFDTIKLKLLCVIIQFKMEKNIASDDEEAPNNSESSIDKKNKQSRKLWQQFVKKSHHLKNI